jgi:hypothetical protein
MAAKKKKLWFGFLEAGEKGSPVVRDAGLETGSPKTVYLFNFMKGKILEYRWDIVGAKLRELTERELAMVPEMRKSFMSAREGFEPRPARQRVAAAVRVKAKPPEDEIPDIEDDDDFSFDPGVAFDSDGPDDVASAGPLD